MSDVEILRAAAARMRELAEGATPGPWASTRCHHQESGYEHSVISADPFGQFADTGESMVPEEDARHIAAWHPTVALAVADFLDAEHAATADRQRRINEIARKNGWDAPDAFVSPPALKLARAFFGLDA